VSGGGGVKRISLAQTTLSTTMWDKRDEGERRAYRANPGKIEKLLPIGKISRGEN